MKTTSLQIAALCAASLATIFLYRKMASDLLRPASTERVFRKGDVILGTLIALWFVASCILGANQGPAVLSRSAILASAVLYITLVIGLFCFLVIRKINPVSAFQLRVNRPVQVLLQGLGWCAAAYPLIFLAQVIGFQLLGHEKGPQDIVRFLMDHPDAASRLTVLATALVVAPVAEEVIFRGYLYRILKQYGGALFAAFLTAALFAAVHLHAPIMPALFILALCLTLVYEHTQTLWAPIVMHASFNSVAVAMVLAFPEISV